MEVTQGDYLAHYGILRKSGRYPWGSGQNPLQRSKTFIQIIEDHVKIDGMSYAQIAKAYSPVDEKTGLPIKKYQLTSTDLRALKSIAVNEVKQDQIRTAQKLKDKGMGYSDIARSMSTPEKKMNESTVRSLLEPGRLEKLDVLQSTVGMLKRQVEEKEFLDVGANVEKDLPTGLGDNPGARYGLSPDKFKTALSMLKEEGYNVHSVTIPLVTSGDPIKYKVLVKPGVTAHDAFINRHKIRTISEKSPDGGKTWDNSGFKPPLNIDLKRVGINYKEHGGADADGVIFVRPGVKDVDLGKARYAQVRIAVGGTHYLKGMAVYKDDLPAGVDLQFNTNKSNTGNKLDALKPLKKDKETGEVDSFNPFGAIIKDGGQILGKDGKPTSVMNLVNEEGDWDKWSKTISRQVLSKQSPELAKSQLNFTYEERRKEFDTIKALTNPQVKRKLLESFGDETDSAAVHLKAAQMPRQATKVILPSNHVKPTEIYAPTFHDGERVSLIRFPHAGTFEIPELTVNNRSREIKKMFGGRGDAPDAVVIHPKVAEHLSGADFDGDHVVVIPNNRGQIKNAPALEGLKNFDTKSYHVPLVKTEKHPDGIPTISSRTKQQEMGIGTNLIADMTIKGASSEELARAVRHSMVVIDSEKHNLDYKASARDHGIAELKRKYQGVHEGGQLKGASTLITRATAQTHPFKRKAAPAGPGLVRVSKSTIDVKTGKKVWVDTEEINSRTGEKARFKSKRLAETDDAYSLVSTGRGTQIEQVYADHSNRLKALGNEIRKELVNTKKIPYSKSAKKVYSHEVASLNAQLTRAELNSPLERQAQVVAHRIIAQKRRANPNMENDELKKIKSQALSEARLRTGALKRRIDITPREWEAIQSGAISSYKLERILNNTDIDKIREKATPRVNTVMTDSVTARAKAKLAQGYTLAEVAEDLGIPLSTLKSGVA